MARRVLLTWWMCFFALLLLAAPTRADVDDEPSEKSAEEDYYELYKVLADTLDQVERNYVEDVSRRELVEAAIEGVIKKLDPYSNYIAPEEMDRFRGAIEREFGGIGIMIGIDPGNGRLRITSPLFDTPAYRAGLLAGDHIVEIEGEPTEGFSIDDAVRRLKGEQGTEVTFTVVHPNGERETVTIEREIIHIQTVLGDRRKQDDTWDYMFDDAQGIGYVRLTAFSRDTARDLRRAVRELEERGLKGLIVDLRFNPGGLLSSAIEICDMFVSGGRIVSTKGRNRSERSWDAHEPGTFEDFPMAILVNRYSASASEIVSACLQDHDRAVVIGERTWGKGSVQSVVDLEGGRSALKITTHSYWRPNGQNIHRGRSDTDDDEWGVTPNDGFMITLRDGEMMRMLDDRRERDVLVSHANENSDDEKDDDAPDRPVDEDDTGDGKPDDENQAKPNDDALPEGGADEENADERNADEADDSPRAEADDEVDDEDDDSQPAPFVDRQLQKAVDYLTTRLAKAG